MKITSLILVSLLTAEAWAQKSITVESIYRDHLFEPETVSAVNWMNDGGFYTALKDNRIVKFDVTNGQQVETLFDGNDCDPIIIISDYNFDPNESKILILTDRKKIYRRSFTAKYYVFDLRSGSLKLLSDAGAQSYATFSPDGHTVAFVRANNLFMIDLKSGEEVQITDDGEPNKIIHGSTDWVYEEELYLTKAFFWSKDGSQLAYYTFDESQVPEYNMQVWKNGKLYPNDQRFKYPKAGQSNSMVRISVFHLKSGEIVNIDLGTDQDIYIPRIQWTYSPNELSILRLNRLQNQLDLLHADSRTGATKLVLSEKSEQYIESKDDTNLRYLENRDQFVFLSDRSGFNHFYLYSNVGEVQKQITSGDWEVTKLIGIDENQKVPSLYYVSTEGSPLERNFFVTDLAGIERTRLGTDGGINAISMSRDFKYYLRYFNNPETPLSVHLFRVGEDAPVTTLENNSELMSVVKEYGVVSKEFFQFTTTDGVIINGFLLKPKDFQQEQEYPLLIYQYSGPGSQEVQNAFAARRYYWHQMMVQRGYLVAYIDPRGTSGRGSKFGKITHGQLGKFETQDLIEGAEYLRSQPFVDAKRIGIWGWSYGGYTAALCMMLGSDVFKTGISVAPVTNWRFYDTIYSERYLKRPQDNPSGYDDYSPTTHAEKLSGRFLLIHGTGDDNVHFQNSVALQSRLIQAGKQFESFYYPDKSHSISGDKTRVHLFQMMTDFITDNL